MHACRHSVKVSLLARLEAVERHRSFKYGKEHLLDSKTYDLYTYKHMHKKIPKSKLVWGSLRSPNFPG